MAYVQADLAALDAAIKLKAMGQAVATVRSADGSTVIYDEKTTLAQMTAFRGWLIGQIAVSVATFTGPLQGPIRAVRISPKSGY